MDVFGEPTSLEITFGDFSVDLLDVGHLLPKVLNVSLLNSFDFYRHHILLILNLDQLFLHKFKMVKIRKICLTRLIKHRWPDNRDSRL